MAKLIDVVKATYGHVLTHWHPASMGPKPAAELFIQAHALGCRPGKQALARALELRDGGATDGQVKAACIAQYGNSGSHHNKRGELQAAKLVTVVKSKPGAHTVYAIKLTDKGVARVKAGGPEPVKVETVKPKAKRKPATPKAPAEPAPVMTEQPAQQAPAEQPAAQ